MDYQFLNTLQEIAKEYQKLKIDSIRKIKLPECKIDTEINFKYGLIQHGNLRIYSNADIYRNSANRSFIAKNEDLLSAVINEEKIKLQKQKDNFAEYFSSLLNEEARTALMLGKISNDISRGNITVALEELLYSLYGEFFIETYDTNLEFVKIKISGMPIKIFTYYLETKKFTSLEFTIKIENGEEKIISIHKGTMDFPKSPIITINLINFYYDNLVKLRLFFSELKILIEYMNTEYAIKGV